MSKRLCEGNNSLIFLLGFLFVFCALLLENLGMKQVYNSRNKDLIVNINSQLSHRDEAGVSPFDSSVQNGDAVWEGLRLYNGRIFKLKEHLARLRKSASLLQYEGFPEDDYIIDHRNFIFYRFHRDGDIYLPTLVVDSCM